MSKIGFRTAGFREWPLQKAVQSLAAIGFDGVELCLEHPELRPETLGASQGNGIAAMVGDCGLEIASVSYHGDREDHAQRVQNQLSSILLTAALGARILILNGEHMVAGQAEVQWAEFVRHLRETLLPAAADHGVLLALEPEPGMYLNGTAEMLRLLAECAHPALGVNLDIGHAWLTDTDLPQSVRDLGNRIFHLHWEDFPTGEHRHLVPGEGDMPLVSIHRELQQIGYGGYYTIDLFNITDDPQRYARASLTACRRLLEKE